MIILALIISGLCFGSFANATVWRIHEQSKSKSNKLKGKSKEALSIIRGRSMCPHCRHELGAQDLIPVISWLSLGGKCRYCKKPISWQYPIVELLTALLFVFSYIYWPSTLQGGILQEWVLFGFWLVFLVGFMILMVYDIRWFLLPDRVVYPLFVLALVQILVVLTTFGGGLDTVTAAMWGVLIGGGIFYVLFQLSGGKWIGGGDVKLGAMLGLLLGGPAASLLMLFLASCLGTVVAVPLLISGKAKRDTHLPFGPFLILAAIIVYIFGASIITWYKRQFLFY